MSRLVTLVFVCWSLCAVGAPPRVLLARSNGPREAGMIKRLEAELRVFGFDVVQRDVGGSVARALLDTLAQSEGAFAAVALTEAGRAVEVWIEDRLTGKTLIRTLIADDDAVIATRAAELLQVSFLELSLRPPATPVPPEVQRVVEQAAPRLSDRRWLLSLGVMGGVTPQTGGRLGPVIGAQVAFGSFLAGARVVGPGMLGLVRGEAGSATLTDLSLLADVGARFHLGNSASLIASALGGAHFVSGVGAALGFNVSNVSSAWTPAVGARVEVIWALDGRIGLRGGIEGVVGLLPVRVLLGTTEVASTPAPLLLATAGLVVGL